MDMDAFTFVLAIVSLSLAYHLIKTWLHYAYGPARMRKVERFQQQSNQDLANKAERLEERIYQLERILDRDLPGWEKRG
ncbi:MAG: envelope stress response membrane protein PspB [Oligoflexus sp.]